jgi:hypothetical protein
MQKNAPQTILTLSLASGVLSLILLAGMSAAAFVPVAPCPEGCRPDEESTSCVFCNGQGRSPLLQHWYYLQYRRREDAKISAFGCFHVVPQRPVLIRWFLDGWEWWFSS